MPKFKLDYIYLFSVLALVAIGSLMVFSASPTMALKYGDSFYFIKRHLFYLLLGAAAFLYAFWLDLAKLNKAIYPLLWLSVLLLFLIFIPGLGRSISGASRWIELGFISFQPSELIKITFLLFLARWFTDQKDQSSLLAKFFPPFLVFALISLLIMKQPDLGTVVTIGLSFLAILLLAGINLAFMAALIFSGVLTVFILSVTSPYRLRRLTAYLNPWADPQGTGFQVIQSLLAVGSGSWLGLGLGASRQKYFYLPQQFTDFIFAILCEETGLWGGLGVLILLAVFLARGARIALSTKDIFEYLLAGGITFWLATQAIINIMVVIGLIPTTGIPLPFISYGGTATIINLFAVGLVLNISRRVK